MEWHNQFRAYARAFGRDEVAAILLRNNGREWLEWPAQQVEGLTFTLDADAILDTVPVDDLQHVVGWVHSHPSGLDPHPSGTDDKQVRELAKDMAGNVVEMWIFGGYDYQSVSVTHAVQVEGKVFVSDIKMLPRKVQRTAWDEEASAFYDACQPPPRELSPHIGILPAWYDEEWESVPDRYPATGQLYDCPWCTNVRSEHPGALCGQCDFEVGEDTIATRYA